jgi:hypothetical protein
MLLVKVRFTPAEATYGEFSDFSVVNAENLSFLTGSEAEAWNQVHDE